MRIGLDFGTTNSGAAVYDGRHVHHFALDPTGQDPTVIRSTMYITRDQQHTIGKEAVDLYYEQNIGRPSKMIQQRIGEIEMTLGEVGSVKGYPITEGTYIRDVYALVDELTPGRLLHSLKSGLASNLKEISIFGRSYLLEELIAIFLKTLIQRIEKQTGKLVEGIVMGRPVHFVESGGEQDDLRAQERLRLAAELAGISDVQFELEPVAAALYFELAMNQPKNALVFDLGGGTLDMTVLRLGEPDNRRIYAAGGVGIAGDTFDKRILEGLLLDHFGRNSTWGPDAVPFPNHYTDALLNWQTIPEMIKPETLQFLHRVRQTSSHPRQIRSLESLLANNYAIQLFDEVERAKIALSSSFMDRIQLTGQDIDVWQPITRTQFESLIGKEMDTIRACLQDTIDRSGLNAADIQVAIRTGGSSQIPCIIRMLEEIFGAGNVITSDFFTSVSAGLAIRAWMEDRDT